MKNNSDQQTRKILVDTVAIKTQTGQKPAEPKIYQYQKKEKKKSWCSGCGCLFVLVILLGVYFLFPFSHRFLILGIDRAPAGTMVGRSDTIMAVSVNPLLPTVKVLSIPRDLWVPIPDYGENRINAAHFFAEAQTPGSGPKSALKTVNTNFGMSIRHYVRINLENFPAAIDALGGITLSLSQPMSGYPAGTFQLDGAQALAFVRSRSDGDDFFRMRQGQVFISGFIRSLMNLANWPHMPQFLMAFPKALDTNLPFWLIPRLGVALARASLTGMETLVIDRSMVTPSVTTEGAQILIPNWDVINTFLNQKFK